MQFVGQVEIAPPEVGGLVHDAIGAVNQAGHGNSDAGHPPGRPASRWPQGLHDLLAGHSECARSSVRTQGERVKGLAVLTHQGSRQVRDYDGQTVNIYLRSQGEEVAAIKLKAGPWPPCPPRPLKPNLTHQVKAS
jgi:hypothetical protein